MTSISRAFVLSLLLGACGPTDVITDGGDDAAIDRDARASDGALISDFASLLDSEIADEGVDAAAPGCPIGSTLSFDRTSCPGAPVAVPGGLARSATTAMRGDVVALGGLSVDTLPCVPVRVCVLDNAATMLFSDDPESPSVDGIRYADVIGPGPCRVYVNHTNGGIPLRKFSVVMLNQGGADVHATVRRRGVAGPGADYVALGKAAASDWLATPGVGSVVTVPPATRVLFDADLDGRHAGKDEVVHAIIDFTLDGPIKLSVVSVAAAVDAATATAQLPLLGDDGLHNRDTYPGADLLLASPAPLDGASARRLELGGDVTDVPLPGVDFVDGNKAVTLLGNYGVVYRVDLNFAGHAALMAAPRGGAWGGVSSLPAGEDGPSGIVDLPAGMSSLDGNGDAAFAGRFAAQTAVSLQLISAGGSNLPVDLLTLPLL